MAIFASKQPAAPPTTSPTYARPVPPAATMVSPAPAVVAATAVVPPAPSVPAVQRAKVSTPSVDPDIAKQLSHLARTVNAARKKAAESIIEAGLALVQANELLASHDGGSFGRWLKQACKMSRRSAYNYMAAARLFGGCATVAQRAFEPQALHVLAATAAPSAAVAEALKMAEAGQVVTVQVARRLVRQHTPHKQKQDKPERIVVLTSTGAVIIQPSMPGLNPTTILRNALHQLEAEQRQRGAA